MAYELIETIEVGAGGAASIEFTSIPQDGVDLVVVLSARTSSSGGNNFFGRFNSDTGSNYSYINLQGDGSSVRSTGTSSTDRITFGDYGYVPGSTYTANTFSSTEIRISNYTSSSAKSISQDGVGENNATAAGQNITAASWSGTAAITAFELYVSGETFVQYSTASLFKIS